MVNKADDLKTEYRENMRGGEGTVKITHFVGAESLYEKGRLFAQIVLEKGCSIGYHTHETDSEIFQIVSGSAEYNDNSNVVTANKGDVLICPKGQGHSIKNVCDEPLVLTALIVYA